MMAQPSLFKRHLALTLILVAVFAFVAFEASVEIIEIEHKAFVSNSPVYLARLVDRIDPGDPVHALAIIDDANHAIFSRSLWLLDGAGNVLYPKNKAFPYQWKNFPRPEVAYDHEPLNHREFPPSKTGVVRLAGDVPRYLFVESKSKHSHDWKILGVCFGLLGISLACALVLSLALIYSTLKRKAKLADEVLSELQKGNLKARFPVTRMDEFGQAMVRFNRMADEIEHLVERVRSAERARSALVQELAHDLRTPLASLGSLLETLNDRDGKLEPEVRAEFLQLALSEVRYFSRLVEDLLFLAQVSEPQYRKTLGEVALAEILQGEIERAAKVHGEGKKVVLRMEDALSGSSFPGDAFLLTRALRNVLDNAFSFAKSSVTVSLRKLDAQMEVVIDDDGPGLSGEALKAFGERRVTRAIGESGGRLSVGLGSVIARTVTLLHRGDIAIRNREDGLGHILGASLRIVLPT